MMLTSITNSLCSWQSVSHMISNLDKNSKKEKPSTTPITIKTYIEMATVKHVFFSF